MDNMKPAVKKGFERMLQELEAKENASNSKKYPQKQKEQKEQTMRPMQPTPLMRPMQEPKSSIPKDMRQDVENAKKDEQVQKEYEAGEKARKENMGKIGFKSGGSVGSASKRADGIAQRGKTKGRIV